MNLQKALNWRYAVRKFSDEKIHHNELTDLLEATRLTASSYGLQPYKIIVVDSVEARQRLLPFSYGQDKIENCSHLIVFAAHSQIGDSTVDRYINKIIQITNKPTSELANYSDHMKSALAAKSPGQRQEWAHQQAYIALGNFLTSAALMKIDCCPMTGIDQAGYDQVLDLPEKGLTTTAICALGKRHPEDDHAHAPKIRFDFREIILEI